MTANPAREQRPALGAYNAWPVFGAQDAAEASAPETAGQGAAAPQPRSAFNKTLKGQVECRGGCGRMLPDVPRKTGLCRECWLDPAKRPGGNPAKREPAEMLSAATRILVGVVARDLDPLLDGEDPGVVLPPLLKAKAVIDRALRRAGQAQVARVGSSAVAVDLTLATGEKWSPQRVDSRWGAR